MGTPTIGGDITGAVTEDSGLIVAGALEDIGFGTGSTDDIWSISTGASYGTATIDPNTGDWSYDLDDSNPVVDALDAGESLTDTFVVLMEDTSGVGAGQTDTQVITITITGVPCLAAGTHIKTKMGPRKIEDIQVDDLIAVQGGYKRVRWVGGRDISGVELQENPKLRPIRIKAGALGTNLPMRDLLVSRQHRMMLRSKIAVRMFNTSEVLVPAIKLVDLPGISVDETVESVTYFHLLFDRHEVIFAEAVPTESLFTGPEALKTVNPQAREEILTLFPRLAEDGYVPTPAHPIPLPRRQKRLVQRHLKNDRPLLELTSNQWQRS